jgi:hypothetical protein
MPKARKTDPQTSHEAAKSVGMVSETQLIILRLLGKPMSDQQLVLAYSKLMPFKAPLASESGIRSRRAELVQLGLVEAKGESKTLFGRKCIVWGQI